MVLLLSVVGVVPQQEARIESPGLASRPPGTVHCRRVDSAVVAGVDAAVEATPMRLTEVLIDWMTPLSAAFIWLGSWAPVTRGRLAPIARMLAPTTAARRD